MWTPVWHFLAASGLIVLAGVGLTWFADSIAQRTGWGRLLVGGLFLAGATSLPELSVGVSAARQGFPDIAVGELTGSSILNLLILGLLDLTHHSRRRMLSRISAAHALAAVSSVAMTGLVALFVLVRWPAQVGGLSISSLVIISAYVLGFRMIYYDQVAERAKALPEVSEKQQKTPGMLPLKAIILGYLVCAVVIFGAAPRLATSTSELASLFGLSESFAGAALVAFATSLPESVTSLAALRTGALDLAIGNLFGSNSFNMLLVAVVDLSSPYPLFPALSLSHAFTCVATILVTSVAVMGQLYQVERRKPFLEPDALLVIALGILSLAGLYWLGDVTP